MSYLIWKLVHVVSVIMFLGNIATGLFWAAHAHRSRDFHLIAATFHGIIRSDRLFTLPGVIGILVGGFGGAIDGKLPILGTGWILWGSILFAISGLVFGLWVAPLQRRIARFADGTERTDDSWKIYERMYVRWELWGLLALLTPVAAMVMMILKPALPGL